MACFFTNCTRAGWPGQAVCETGDGSSGSGRPATEGDRTANPVWCGGKSGRQGSSIWGIELAPGCCEESYGQPVLVENGAYSDCIWRCVHSNVAAITLWGRFVWKITTVRLHSGKSTVLLTAVCFWGNLQHMLKAALLLMIAGVVSASAQTTAKPSPCASTAVPCRVAMPEPTAIPELALGLIGVIGFAVWRQRKQAKLANR